MKKLVTLISTLAYLLIGTSAFSQAPQKFNYQGIARDAKGNPIGKQTLALKLSVLPTSDATVPEYEETQIVSTNEFGLYTLQIGGGTIVTGDMKTVKWETGNKYIKVAIDTKGGTDYVDMGTTQLLSVPYAIYADKAGNMAGEDNGTRTGTVSTSAAGTGIVNYLTKFTAANTIYNSQIFDNGSQIGIGTTTPSTTAKVHISSATGTQPMIFESPLGVHCLFREAGVNRGYFGSYVGSGGAYPTPAGTSNDDFDIGTSGASVGKLHLVTNTTPRVTIMPTTGNMGVGTTSPTTKLEVAGQVKITGGTPGAGKVLTSDATGLATWQTPTGGGGSLSGTLTANQIPKATGASTLSDSQITDDGTSVGIGTATPFHKLQVVGGSFNVANSGLSRSMTYDPSSYNLLFFNGGNAEITTVDFNSNMNIQKYTDTKLGIGNPAPNAKLDVIGVGINGTVSKGSFFGVQGTCDSNGIVPLIPIPSAGVYGSSNGTFLTNGVYGTSTVANCSSCAAVSGWGNNGNVGVKALGTGTNSIALEVAGPVRASGTASNRFAQKITVATTSNLVDIPLAMSSSEDDILLVTHVYKVQYINSPVSVWWNTALLKWQLFREDGGNINAGEIFNVIALKN